MDGYAWRSCAGRTSDAIQFAAQMGFVERNGGAWHLHLSDMLRFFGGEQQPKIDRTEKCTCVSTPLWNGDFGLSLVGMLASPDKDTRIAENSRLNLSISLRSYNMYHPQKPIGYDMLADNRGVNFNCIELGGSISAAQLMQILAMLGDTMDKHVEWRFFDETM
ncbi:hypothetical protein J6X15_01160 [Candidatus Saccharibacteria bacterium]|nr:hypothetical protein [Candidatus Saccharibacteria bacterium]